MKQSLYPGQLMSVWLLLFLVLNATSQTNHAGKVSDKDLTESYRILKKEYSYKNYTFDSNDMYNPYLSGFASIVPGLGQVITGEPGRGLLYIGGMGVSVITFLVGYGMAWDRGSGNTVAEVVLITGFTGFLTFYFANIVNAVRIAKVKNLALADKTLGIHFEPQIRIMNQYQQVNAFGLGVYISF